jgi:hypothetical protein
MLERIMKTVTEIAQLPDNALLDSVARAVAVERRATAELIALLGELDVRRLYLGQGCSSLFTYCTQVLHLSEHAAYGRIEAARAVRSYPVILELLVEGAITLTAIGLLRQHLTADNHRPVLQEARHKTKREVEEIVARLRPRSDAATVVRKLPGTKPAPAPESLPLPSRPDASAPQAIEQVAPALAMAKRPVVTALAPERYKIQFTVSAATHAKLRRAQDLLRHAVPTGDPAEVFDRALTKLLEHLERTRLATAKRPHLAAATSRPHSRRIPAAVKREVWARDAGRCAFVGAQGRCRETGFLEFHHVEPFAVGGARSSRNIQLRCRAHNVYEAELFFGVSDPPTVREMKPPYSVRENSVWTEFEGSRRFGPERNGPVRNASARKGTLSQPDASSLGRPTGNPSSAVVGDRTSGATSKSAPQGPS